MKHPRGEFMTMSKSAYHSLSIINLQGPEFVSRLGIVDLNGGTSFMPLTLCQLEDLQEAINERIEDLTRDE